MSGMTSAIGSVVLSSTSSKGVARGRTTDDGTRCGANAAAQASNASVPRMLQHCSTQHCTACTHSTERNQCIPLVNLASALWWVVCQSQDGQPSRVRSPHGPGPPPVETRRPAPGFSSSTQPPTLPGIDASQKPRPLAESVGTALAPKVSAMTGTSPRLQRRRLFLRQ